eukprot:Cvel_35241.t1-p1 / transcript=Cvel_35241.t1 / gene=Cvel_35241 / organism=Chromera_velia_CCMP2878 / gene_product=hypothetical protein / transcript_product=hypothetical protein / location=Cvel_scaffold6362:1036-2172(+) / protein_length=200 / sequence_SO=supercontig / SO=protein_coding / is_pseudo=false
MPRQMSDDLLGTPEPLPAGWPLRLPSEHPAAVYADQRSAWSALHERGRSGFLGDETAGVLLSQIEASLIAIVNSAMQAVDDRISHAECKTTIRGTAERATTAPFMLLGFQWNQTNKGRFGRRRAKQWSREQQEASSQKFYEAYAPVRSLCEDLRREFYGWGDPEADTLDINLWPFASAALAVSAGHSGHLTLSLGGATLK